MSNYFVDSNSIVIFVVGVLVTTIFIVEIWDLMREGITQVPGTLSTKIKKINANKNGKKIFLKKSQLENTCKIKLMKGVSIFKFIISNYKENICQTHYF